MRPALIAVIPLVSSSFAGDPGPTLDETVTFIRTKITEADKAEDDPLSELTFDKADFTLTIQTNRSGLTSTHKVNIADCDPNRVTVETATFDHVGRSGAPYSHTIYWVRLAGTNDKTIAYNVDSGGGSTEWSFRVATNEDANRVVKAFQRLITLSGGKKSLF